MFRAVAIFGLICLGSAAPGVAEVFLGQKLVCQMSGPIRLKAELKEDPALSKLEGPIIGYCPDKYDYVGCIAPGIGCEERTRWGNTTNCFPVSMDHPNYISCIGGVPTDRIVELNGKSYARVLELNRSPRATHTYLLLDDPVSCQSQPLPRDQATKPHTEPNSTDENTTPYVGITADDLEKIMKF